MEPRQEDTQPEALATPQQRRGMRDAVLAQCFGELGLQAFEAQIMLLYLTALGFSPSTRLLVLSIPWAVSSLGVLPCALLADRFGKKRIGMPGVVLSAAGFATLATLGWAPESSQVLIAMLGAGIFGMGASLMESSWFALLVPIVPDPMRGRFFGVLRTSWRSVGVLVIGACILLLDKDSPIADFQLVAGLIAGLMAVRIWFYARIPDIEPKPTLHTSVGKALGDIIRAPGYTSFCAYTFLLMLCVIGVPALFGLVQKDVLAMGDNQVGWMGTLMMIGSMVGFWFGGKAVDRYTTRPVFLMCHFGFGVVILLFVLRGHIGLPMLPTVGTLSFLFGLVMAGSSIAITTETLALIPPENKSLSTSCCRVLMRTGGALSGMLAAWVLDQGLLADSWTLWGKPMSAYDAILLLTAVMVVLLVVTLGLVPSVLRKAEWLPGR